MLNKPAAIAGAINGFFIKKIKTIIANVPPVLIDPKAKLRERMRNRQYSLSFQEMTKEQVFKTIESIKPTTATGVDHIDNRKIKLISTEITPALMRKTNLSITSNTFPSLYKMSKVTPLLKKIGLDPILPASYRPLNQLVGLAKIVGRCVFGQLVNYLEENFLLHPNQHGGRTGHSKCIIK